MDSWLYSFHWFRIQPHTLVNRIKIEPPITQRWKTSTHIHTLKTDLPQILKELTIIQVFLVSSKCWASSKMEITDNKSKTTYTSQKRNYVGMHFQQTYPGWKLVCLPQMLFSFPFNSKSKYWSSTGNFLKKKGAWAAAGTDSSDTLPFQLALCS